jgi:hypothetical protein
MRKEERIVFLLVLVCVCMTSVVIATVTMPGVPEVDSGHCVAVQRADGSLASCPDGTLEQPKPAAPIETSPQGAHTGPTYAETNDAGETGDDYGDDYVPQHSVGWFPDEDGSCYDEDQNEMPCWQDHFKDMPNMWKRADCPGGVCTLIKGLCHGTWDIQFIIDQQTGQFTSPQCPGHKECTVSGRIPEFYDCSFTSQPAGKYPRGAFYLRWCMRDNDGNPAGCSDTTLLGNKYTYFGTVFPIGPVPIKTPKTPSAPGAGVTVEPESDKPYSVSEIRNRLPTYKQKAEQLRARTGQYNADVVANDLRVLDIMRMDAVIGDDNALSKQVDAVLKEYEATMSAVDLAIAYAIRLDEEASAQRDVIDEMTSPLLRSPELQSNMLEKGQFASAQELNKQILDSIHRRDTVGRDSAEGRMLDDKIRSMDVELKQKYKQILTANPNNEVANLILGKLYYGDGDDVNAHTYFRRAFLATSAKDRQLFESTLMTQAIDTGTIQRVLSGATPINARDSEALLPLLRGEKKGFLLALENDLLSSLQQLDSDARARATYSEKWALAVTLNDQTHDIAWSTIGKVSSKLNDFNGWMGKLTTGPSTIDMMVDYENLRHGEKTKQ